MPLIASQPLWAQTIWRARGALLVVVKFCGSAFASCDVSRMAAKHRHQSLWFAFAVLSTINQIIIFYSASVHLRS
jgi:hypothetical protein